MARTVTSAELMAVVLLVLGGSWTRWGAVLATALLVLFTCALALLLVQRRRVSCNCFGSSSDPVSGYDLIRNIILLTWALVALGFGATGANIGSSTQQEVGTTSLLEWALLVLAASGSAFIVANLSSIGRLLCGDRGGFET